MLKEVLGAVAIFLTLAAFAPYIRSIRRDETKPHVFSWLIWGSTTIIVALAQLSDHGGAGAWPIGFSGLITLYVAFLAYQKSSKNTITSVDWLFFVAAISSIPLWYFTHNPLWAVVILTTIDLLGFVPTFRKAYSFPNEEKLTFFAIITLRNIIAIAALQHYSLTTILFPALTGLACVLLIMLVTYRRRLNNL